MITSFINLDLNLLRVFDAIMQERSVLRASQKLFLSQSAVSHSLARLREVLDDELFIRTSTGMQPTARASLMAPPVRHALKSMEVAVEQPRFIPATSTRTFTLAASDFTTMIIAPRLLDILACEAPSIDIVIRPVTRIDLAEQIDLGRIDAAIGTFSAAPQRFKSDVLFEYDDVLITSASNDLGLVTIEILAGLSLIVVSFGGEPEGAIDGFISERGLARRSEMYDRNALEQALSSSETVPRIALTLPHFLALPSLLAGSTLAAIVPRPLAHTLSQTNPIVMYELPYATAHLEVRSLWHERHESDISQTWLHGMLGLAAQHLRTANLS